MLDEVGGQAQLISSVLDEVGLVGQELRSDLQIALADKVLKRVSPSPLTVWGSPGTGKHQVARAAHLLFEEKTPSKNTPMRLWNARGAHGFLGSSFHAAIDEARGGTFVLEGYNHLGHAQRQEAEKVFRERQDDARFLILSSSVKEEGALGSTKEDVIALRPLHERARDIEELVDYFFLHLKEDLKAHPGLLENEGTLSQCMGFSRQAKEDISGAIVTKSLKSVRRLRALVQDVLYSFLDATEFPRKILSEHVHPHLEREFGQQAETRQDHEMALLLSQFEDWPSSLSMEVDLTAVFAQLHGVPREVLEKQSEILRDIMESIHDVPKSYRNVMTKFEDVQRASLWMLTGAHTQAEFRKFFGTKAFMRPNKSVAWAFYNRVFKRNM